MSGGQTLGQILTSRGDLVRAASGPFSAELPQTGDTAGDDAMAVSWQESMRLAIRDTGELRRRLGLASDGANLDAIGEAEKEFPTFVPLEFLSRIRPGDPRDPLLLQVMAVADESVGRPGFVSDPVGDTAARVAPALLQKYAGRALVITTGVCGVHCRYCFRREFDYSASNEDFASSPSVQLPAGQLPGGQLPGGQPPGGPSGDPWAAGITHLRGDRSIDEVILSGGDPLTLSDAKFDRLVTAIESVPHVRRLRIHSRMPIVIPQRVTEAWVNRIRSSRLATWMVIHCNHAQEIDGAVSDGIARMVDVGIPVLNQAVLLAGVNDDAQTLATLSRELVNRRVQPYYLHQLDRIAGASHFEVSVDRGREIVEAMRAMLPGYAVPTYVTEVEGAASKVPN
jgi:L-lysine 2,3-aminomutase